ncbi:MAG: nicotinate-nucleotide pyrophosphorylase (carboxylating) [Gammaproteobacteria bacterium]|jgi:nicotinate-nucleotide pyrophosphorylase (carboxylating)|nr:nicotinate-nucleotide pyrophosphorylase (carboxylating) [Gammaproteobacteria bacterium]
MQLLSSIDLQLIDLALAEDLGLPYRDITTSCLFPGIKNASANIISKHEKPIVLSGLSVVNAVLQKLDYHLETHCEVQSDYQDGDVIEPGFVILTISGYAHTILMAERTLLNFLQHLSAIATFTAEFVDAVKQTKAKILDTRKTTPGWRHLEKYAVQCGGGVNHRLGLYDAVMMKDTHIDLLGGMRRALTTLPNDRVKKFPVIVEVRTQDELKIILKEGLHKVSRVLLDNMSPKLMSECVEMCCGKITTEASGNITLESVALVAKSGVDFISVGKITHSAGNVDLSMKSQFPCKI